ncbi:MAG TPA: hypothetical protein VJB87_04275 [Candidatus Nanoarchaeia archaeon]|nr:hypothetical protein [Candidatus Nanoarchaeia archaeon]
MRNFSRTSSNFFTAVFLFSLIFLASCSSSSNNDNGPQVDVGVTVQPGEVKTFSVRSDADVCVEDGKPVIRLFSTTWCPHCQWVKSRFTKVVQEYVRADKIVAYHWVLDSNDDDFTSVVEGSVPESELAVYKDFNPQGSIPTFVMGCKYYRVGNGYEAQNDLGAEETEFRTVIEKLIEEAGSVEE